MGKIRTQLIRMIKKKKDNKLPQFLGLFHAPYMYIRGELGMELHLAGNIVNVKDIIAFRSGLDNKIKINEPPAVSKI